MSRLNAWFIAIIVLDANILLGLYRVAPETRRQRLEVLEALRDRIWIPRQFWNEYRRRRHEMRAHISKEYKTAHSNLQSNREKSKKSLIHLRARFSYEAKPYIDRIDALYAELTEDVMQYSNEHINNINHEEIDGRIEALVAGKLGEPLPDSTIADIPSMWQWRLDHGIPPGLKDCEKPVPNRYGDLIGWLQIIRHAVGRGRPVIMVTDDKKPNDWFVLKNGKPSGPHPELTRELYDEAGVELYLFTSEHFMWLANRYLKWQRHVAESGHFVRRPTQTIMPDFRRIATIGTMPVLPSTKSILRDYANTFGTIAGLSAGESTKNSLNSITALFDSYKPLLNTLAAPTINDSLQYIVDNLSSANAALNQYSELQRSTDYVLNSVREQQRLLADTVNPIRRQQQLIADIVNPIRGQQRLIADIMRPIRE